MVTTARFVKDNVQVINRQKINGLVKLAKEKSYRMPSGLTREQRREWAKTISKKV